MDVAKLIITVILAGIFLAMGVLHFVPAIARGMAAMVPPGLRWRVPSPLQLVWFTGVCELAGGVGLLIPELRLAASIALVIFLIAVFPANAFAAKHPEKFGKVATPFWPRLAGQLALIGLLIFQAL